MHVVCYDVSDDGARSRVSRILLGYGSRVQESVFECILDESLVNRLVGDLGRVGLAETDKVRMYKMCGTCVRSLAIYGQGEVTVEPDFYFI
jgi:CRISPR-associated protein Cas2